MYGFKKKLSDTMARLTDRLSETLKTQDPVERANKLIDLKRESSLALKKSELNPRL